MTTAALLAAVALPAFAAFEDVDLTPRTAALGGAFTGSAEGTAGLCCNPAGLAAQRKPEFVLGFGRLREVSAGPTDRTDLAAGAAGPWAYGRAGGWGVAWRREETNLLSVDKRVFAGWAARGAWESADGRLDVGGGLSLLSREPAAGSSSSSFGLDVGALLYWGSRYRAGLALLNVNQPSMDAGAVKDRAPRALKVGLARTLPFWSLTVDATQRASSRLGAGGLSVASGIEHWWSRSDLGAAALRSGLSLGGEGKLFTAGFSLQRGGAELQYAGLFPLSGGKIGHQLAFAFYFGGREPRDVYQQLLRQEREAREDLHRLVERQEELLAKLRQDLLNSRIEVERLRLELESRPAADAQKADEKLRWLLELQDQLRRDLREAEGRRKSLEKKRQEPGFQDDWAAYEKLKASGAPPHVLAESLRALIEKHRGSGADLSAAYGEFIRVQEGR